MLLLGICGASGSGKSTLANELCSAVHASSVVLNQDAYYFDHPQLSFEERCALNYDEPSIFDHDLLLEDVKALEEGKKITKKAYDFAHHCRADTNETVAPAEIVIVEGLHVFYDKRLREKMFLKLYMSVEPDICLLRRINRDILERGRSIDNISAQYLSTVKPMYDRYIRNYIADADIVVMRGGKNARIVDVLAGYVRDELEKKKGI